MRPGCRVSSVPSSISLTMNDHPLPFALPPSASALTLRLSPGAPTLKLKDYVIPQWMGTPSSGVHVFYDRPLCPEVFFCQRNKAMLHTHAHVGRGGEKEWSSTSFEYPHHHFRERQISLSLERVKLLSLLLTSGQMMVPMAYHPHLCLPLLLLCSFSRPLCSFPFPLPQIWISTILLSDQMIN